MLKASKRIILTSEKLNSFGFRVLTEGVDFSQFEKNPVLLWMHLRAFQNDKDVILPLGNVIELKRETHPDYGKVITGQPMFDDTDPFAKRIYDKLENGTIRMASAGLKPQKWSDDPELLLPDQIGFTLSESILQEVSMVDIGSNDDSLSIALYDQNDELITLSHTSDNAAIPLLSKNENQSEIQMKTIQLNAPELLVKLGLADSASATEVEAKISEVITLSAQQAVTIQTLTDGKLESENKVIELQKKLDDAEIVSLVDNAEAEGKITKGQREHFIKLANADKATVEEMFKGLPVTHTVQKQLSEEKKSTVELYAGKSWAELDKANLLVQLKNEDPNLFAEKYEEKFGKKS